MEWWQWVLTIFGGLVTFSVSSGALAIAAYIVKAFFSVHTNISGIREELGNLRGDVKIMANQITTGFDAGERRFEALEERVDKQSRNIQELKSRMDSSRW